MARRKKGIQICSGNLLEIYQSNPGNTWKPHTVLASVRVSKRMAGWLVRNLVGWM